MSKKIIGILICLLLIATAVPAIESLKNSTINSTVPSPPPRSMAANWTEMQKLLASDGAAWESFGWSVSLSGDTALIGFDDENGADSGSAYVFIRTGTTWTQQAKLLASDSAAEDRFGWSVSLSGDTALIGAPQYVNGTSSGSAYVFIRTGTTWTQQAKLLASDGTAGDTFGWYVSLSGDTALIGAPYNDDNGDYSGSAYVFTCNGTTWTQQQKLLASDGAAGDGFGYSVSLSGDTALIGAPYDDDNGYESGSTYVFTRTGTTWTQQQKLLASDGAYFDWFGFSVSLSGDTALIGAPYNDDNGDYSGSAYVFTCNGTTWTQQAKLLASDGAYFDLFGFSVSLSGDTALIGARLDDDAYVFTRTGTTWTQQAKLLASDGATNDGFGFSVSLSGDTALIGAPFDDDKGVDSGSAYVFIRTGTTWTQQAKLLASDGATGDYFGVSVSLASDTALIGAPYDDDNGLDSGSAYVFIRNGTPWTQQQKLLASDGAAYDNFGWSISLSGDTALIGAYGDNDKGVRSGSAYVFTRTNTTWTQQAKLIALDGAAEDAFGYSVSLSGNTALIGAYGDNDKGVTSGSAYVFTRTNTTWTQQTKLIALDGAAEDVFGYSVSLSGDTALIGAPLDDDNGADSGSAYVFIRTGTTWTQQAKLLAADGAAEDVFGYSVSLSGDTALIGALLDDDNGVDSGSAYVFIRTGTTWTQQAKLLASDGAADDWFGYSVSLSGDTALIGAPYDDDNGDYSGSAYVFTRNGTTWTQQQKLLASDGVRGDAFGVSVSLSGDTALIGTEMIYDGIGSVYVFTKESGNQPPVFGTSSPVNGSTNNPRSLSWSIPINDSEGDHFSWTIQCSNGQVNSGTNATNGTKSLALSGLAYSTTYKVWVNATDPTGSGLYTRKWYTFTTKVNQPPLFGSPNPSNGSTNNPRSLSWSIPINDPEGDHFSWTIQCSNGQVNSGTNATNGTKSLALSGLAYLTTYWVCINATDPTGSGIHTGKCYTFTTKASLPPVFGTPSSANGSTDNPLNFSWNIPINDPEGDMFSWAIQCSNRQTISGTGALNGTKSLALSGLAYSTTYKVWVNATDPTGSGLYTRKWYTFTTKVNQPPLFGSPNPSNGSTNNPRSLSWSIPINDPEGDHFSWTIQCSNGQTTSGTGASNGTKSLALSGLAYSTTYKVWVNATDPTGSGLYTRKWYTFTTKASLPPVFDAPTPANGSTDTPLSFTWSIPINDPEGDHFSWTIQCSNGQTTSGTGASNGTKSLALSGLAYSTTYKVWVNTTDPTGSGLYTRKWYTFTTKANHPPNTPTITGPAEGKVRVATDYNFTAIDPDGDEVYYFIDWGDTTNSSWIGPYASGEPITKSHTWSKKATYTVKAKAKDTYGNESDWGTLEVTMPVSINIPFHQLIEKLFERFPHAFPILRHLLGY